MQIALELVHITKSFHIQNSMFTALNDISFAIQQNTCTVIGGANGSGKSLLMSIIAGLEVPDS